VSLGSTDWETQEQKEQLATCVFKAKLSKRQCGTSHLVYNQWTVLLCCWPQHGWHLK